MCILKISIIVHNLQLNHGIPGWLRLEEAAGCPLDSLQYVCVSLELGSPELDLVLHVWSLQCLSKDLFPWPAGITFRCSPKSSQPSLTQGHFSYPCSALATRLWHTSLSSLSAVIGILAEDKPCPIIQTMDEDVKQDWCHWSPARLCSIAPFFLSHINWASYKMQPWNHVHFSMSTVIPRIWKHNHRNLD